jgi:hypothetical protein
MSKGAWKIKTRDLKSMLQAAQTYYNAGDVGHLSLEVRGLLNQSKNFRVGG